MWTTIRVDKYIANLWIISRRSIWKAIASGAILVDWKNISKGDEKVSYWQLLRVYDEEIIIKEFIYILLYKPAWYVCSEIDEGWHASYKTLLQDCPYANLLHVAGRLDFDTEWLVLCSNDGQFTHNIISPKKHLEKEYYVETSTPISSEDLKKLEQWVILDDGYKTLPAKATYASYKNPPHENSIDYKQKILLTITEGKFHQVKRMIETIWSQVTYLCRMRIWDWNIEDLEKGKWKYIEIS